MKKSNEKQIANLYDELELLTFYKDENSDEFGINNANTDRIKAILDELDELDPIPLECTPEESFKAFEARADVQELWQNNHEKK